MTSKIFEISRTLNTITDALARQALSSKITHLESSCSNSAYLQHCSVLQALHQVGLSHVIVLLAVCC